MSDKKNPTADRQHKASVPSLVERPTVNVIFIRIKKQNVTFIPTAAMLSVKIV